MTSPALAPAVAAEPVPLGRRVLLTFVAPHRLFPHLRSAVPWLGVLLISTTVAILLIWTLPDAAFLALTEGAVNRRGEPVEITSNPATIATYGRRLGMLSVMVYQPLIAFAMAGVLTLVFSVLLGGRARFRQYLSIVAHALLITALGGLVGLLLRTVSGRDDLRPSLALFTASYSPESFTFRLLDGIDLFAVWMLIVVALGVSIVNERPSWGRAAAVLLGAYLVVIAVGAAAAG